MFKVGDTVLIKNMECVNHTDNNTCCDCDLTKPVKVIKINEGPYGIDVELPNGKECHFDADELELVEEVG